MSARLFRLLLKISNEAALYHYGREGKDISGIEPVGLNDRSRFESEKIEEHLYLVSHVIMCGMCIHRNSLKGAFISPMSQIVRAETPHHPILHVSM